MNRTASFHSDTPAPQIVSLVRILAGLLFFQHGAEKIWGFAGGRTDHNFATLHGFAGPLEVVGGTFIILGLFTRTTAFILCGEMAVAYFRSWAPRGFFPISNGGEEAVIFCFLYLWLVTAGGGPWSMDRFIESSTLARNSTLKQRLASWEGYGRSITRMILAFTLSLHGLRLAFGLFPASGGRRLASPLALDLLPPALGYWLLFAGILLFVGLLARPVAIVSSVIALAAYLYGAAPRGIYPIRNGGNEALLYLAVFLFIAVAGAGEWSRDRVFAARRRTTPEIRPAAASSIR